MTCKNKLEQNLHYSYGNQPPKSNQPPIVAMAWVYIGLGVWKFGHLTHLTPILYKIGKLAIKLLVTLVYYII